MTETERERIVELDDEPGARVSASGDDTGCAQHGRRKPWLVCRCLARTARENTPVKPDYRMYRIVPLYDGQIGSSFEYHLCYPCAAACGLLVERPDVDAACDLIEDCVEFVCSSCGLERLARPSKRPCVLERRA